MISVTNLTTYMFCPRKLYLLNVLEFEEPPKEAVLLGSVKHNVFDKINKADELIVTSILKSTQQQEIEIIYRKKYSEILRNEIKQNKKIEIINNTNIIEIMGKQFVELVIFNF